MSAQPALKNMVKAWAGFYGNPDGEPPPPPNVSFNRAWLIQQAKIDTLESANRALKFAIHSASTVIEHGTTQEIRDTANYLRAVKRIADRQTDQDE